MTKTIGRNDPCPCGSGKKHKQCCGRPALRPAAARHDGHVVAPQKLLQQALESLQAGRGAEAHALLSQVLQIAPDHPDALHLLGLIAHQTGQHTVAVDLIRRAIGVNPSSPFYYINLGNALQDIGKTDEAAACYRNAISLKPDYAEAHANLGNAFKKQSRLGEAVESFRNALALNPNLAKVHNSLGDILQNQGRLDEAAKRFRNALTLKPGFALAHNNLGNVLRALGKLEEAVASFEKALLIRPDFAEVHGNLGLALKDLGKLDDAVASYRKALSLKPDLCELHNNLGLVLKDQGKLDEAVMSYRTALSLKPDYSEAHNNLGHSLRNQGKLNEALQSFRNALLFQPNFSIAHYNVASALHDQGALDDAAASYRKALAAKPTFREAHSNLLYLHAFSRDISPELECRVAADWENAVLNQRERCAARDRFRDAACAPRARAGRTLRIGIVSAEIGQHAVAEFLEPFLAHIDHARFHITLYPTTARLEPRAARLIALADHSVSLTEASDDDAAERIRSDRIDVLIDTTGHMTGCRLGIFAHRAAPVQCHYIGYHGTTGLTEMDWFIGDEVLLPTFCEPHFREKIWRLPRLWVSYGGDAELVQSRWTPNPDGTVWLGSFNNLNKVREETLSLWAKVMRALPKSRLLLKDRRSADPAVQGRIRAGLLRHSIECDRVEFVARVPDWKSHMAMYDRLDIALDTIPLNSGTTAFDALWMGVPLVALEGNWMGGRMTSAMLRALQRPNWIAQDAEHYAAIVAALARDVEGRIALRKTQRGLMAASPLCDAKGLTTALENAFEAMFDQRLANAAASHGTQSEAAQQITEDDPATP